MPTRLLIVFSKPWSASDYVLQMTKRNKMNVILQKVCKKVGGFERNVLLCSAKQQKAVIMQTLNAYFYSYYYFAWQR